MKVQAARRLSLSIVAALLVSAPLAGKVKEGFGTFKLAVTLARVRPPDIDLTGTRCAVRSWSGLGESPADGQMIAALEDQLLANDPGLELVAENPQTLIELTVRDNALGEGWDEHRSEPTITYLYSVLYRVRDLSTGARLDQDTAVWYYEKAYRDDSDTPEGVQLEAAASTGVARKIAQRLTPTTEIIGALLPKGSLKELGKDAQSGLWDRYLEALVGLPARPLPQDESYRQYALGVAYEALAYAAEEPEATIRELGKAAVHYEAAIAAHPDEEFFTSAYDSPLSIESFNEETLNEEVKHKEAMAPLERVRTGRAQYQKIIDLRAAREQRATSLDDAGAERLTNAVIIRMSQAGLSEQIILTAVETAAVTDFDVSLQGLLALAKAKVSTRVIERMQAIAAARDD